MTGYAVVIRSPSAIVHPDELRALMPALRRRGPHGATIVHEGAFGAAAALLDTGDPRLAPAWVVAGRFLVAGQVRVDGRDSLVDSLRQAGTNASVHDPD